MRYQDYEHEKYESKAKLEWMILGCCPIGSPLSGYDPDGFAPCGKWEWNERIGYKCNYIPGGSSWDGGARCSPLWIKRYNIPKRKEKGEDDA